MTNPLLSLDILLPFNQTFLVKVIEQTMTEWHGLKMAKLLASAAIFIKMGVLQIGISAMVIENQVKTLTITTFLLLAKKALRATAFPVMSSSNHPIIVPSDSDIESIVPLQMFHDYFPSTLGNTTA
ncbi:hypothetical protein Tco_0643727 [Tanacetum coccineum]